jgi:thiamine transport system substrate-binding protein
MIRPSESGPAEPRLRRPGRAGRVLVAIALAATLVLAGVGTYEYVQSEFGGTTLVILTYPSLFGGNCGGTAAFSDVFGAFASAHGIRIDVECPPGTLYSALVNRTGGASVDLVIGLDEITGPQAEAAGLLVPYAPNGLANVPSYLVHETNLGPTEANASGAAPGVVPYEYGYLAVDYNSSFYNATAGAVAQLTFPEVTGNASWAKGLLIEDPEVDITGEEFLAWQVEYYENVLHRNWTTFWSAMPHGAPPEADSWGSAFTEFQQGLDPMVVSYTTDPAYAAAAGASGYYNSTTSWWNGTEYSWRTVYGVGIVDGSRHLALDEEFENWLLSGAVQAEIPLNEWEYPANGTVPVPTNLSRYAVPPGPIVALNNDTTPTVLVAELPGWLATWEGLSSGGG